MRAEPVFGKKHKAGSSQPAANRRPVFVASDGTPQPVTHVHFSPIESEPVMTSSTSSPARPKVGVPPRKRLAQPPKPFPSLVDKKPAEAEAEVITENPVEHTFEAELESEIVHAQEDPLAEEEGFSPSEDMNASDEMSAHEEIMHAEEMEEVRPRQWDLKFALGLIALVVAINLCLTLVLSNDSTSSKTHFDTADKGGITPDTDTKTATAPSRSNPTTTPPMPATAMAKPKPAPAELPPIATMPTEKAAKEAAELAPAAGPVTTTTLPATLPTPKPVSAMPAPKPVTPETIAVTPSPSAPKADVKPAAPAPTPVAVVAPTPKPVPAPAANTADSEALLSILSKQ